MVVFCNQVFAAAKTFAKRRDAARFAVVLVGSLLVSSASAQYKDYPQGTGQVQTLTENKLPSWMTLDMELRGRTEEQTAIDYLAGEGKLYELTRVRGGLEVRPLSWLTGYMQFHDDHALGLPLRYTAANMWDNFDFRQAYLDFHYKPIKVFAGRQELKFGDERLIGVLDWPNVAQTFDGFDARIGDKNRIDLFSASVVKIYPTSLDMHAGGLNYHGAYASINTWIPRTTLEPFVLIKAMPRVLSQQNLYGTETEVTPGIRVAGNIPGGLEYVVTGVLQRGSYSNDSIHSGAGFAKVGYTASSLPWTPRLRGEYDYATGNTHSDAQRISTFDQQYPSAHNVFGLVDLFGWQNIKQTRVNLDLSPYSQLTLLLQGGSLTTATSKDGLYNGAGVLFLKAPSGGFASEKIGTEFDASAKYIYRKYVVTNAGVGHFFPGQVMTQNNHGAPLTIAYLSFSYRFNLH